MKRFLLLLCLMAMLFSCSRNPLKINVSNVQIDLKIKHLDVDLMKLQHDQIQAVLPELKKTYGDFFDIFTYRMIEIGGTEQENFPELLYSFVSDTLNRKLVTDVSATIDTVQLRNDLLEALKHYKYYFPAKETPVIYTCISGFHQSVVTAENLIGISLDKYLGANSRYYKQLGLPVYKRKNMHKKKIVTDMMYGWGVTEWPKVDNGNSLISQMIYEGKMLYFLDAMLPDLSDSIKIGFTEKQLDFCKDKEASMWAYLAERKLLFSTNRMDVKHFTDDGPYTSAFTDQSPARTGTWLGWQIVRSYMKEHPGVKLPELMNDTDFQKIMNQSGYQP